MRQLHAPSALRAILAAHGGCVDCGESDPVVLHFDHRVEGEKAFQIGAGGGAGNARGRGMEAVLKEAAKCDLRCANCHTKRTASRQWADTAEAMRALTAATDTSRDPAVVALAYRSTAKPSISIKPRDWHLRMEGGARRWGTNTKRELLRLLGAGKSMRAIAREGLLRGPDGVPLSLGTINTIFRQRLESSTERLVRRVLLTSALELEAARRRRAV